MLTSTDPRTSTARDTGIEPTSDHGADECVHATDAAFAVLARHDRLWRAGLLDALADGLMGRAADLATIADRETGLGEGRLTGEIARSAFQFRLFAQALRDGGYLEAAIDHAGDTELGPAPELRRILVPLGVVAVFGSSNFPFAFSVAGGDVASALAAGNTVVVKAHSSHLETSAATFSVLVAAATAYGAPEGLLGIVYGTASGRALVAHPRVRAAGFTGSLSAAQALMAVIDQRSEPIPFFGELSSLNPLVITRAAAAARADEIAAGLFGSFTLGSGQFCTKPGLAFVPTGADGDRVVDGLVGRAAVASAQTLLNDRIASSFDETSSRLESQQGVGLLARGSMDGDGIRATPTVLAVAAADLTSAVAEEAFGPLMVVVRYDSLDEVASALASVPGSLTATIHAEPDEDAASRRLVADLSPLVGRIVFNGYPTGVRVSWAQHHGGPWPATNSAHTSVGVTAIRRFLRPIAFQDAPQSVLPPELRDGASTVPRRIDGRLELP
ncbi:aldehyde dehydrogenase (NADP(+)) [Microbacterium sp. Sa4CUA7]|uniref:Aldehyde dehydrogenase (NADP(+)) n=1 Tax=Microbacterium pullorum TaxID=2762236 RepID=A0ABR8S2K6_9MICO|nr:aldehyde dehydrogenase (NADP(+)) [Microbacterium pullorum]MBD7957727.1 aldehyde dehydrogenase (NADP(+)) [Microbacterium pullorum]